MQAKLVHDARCDIESLQYLYWFCEHIRQPWLWSERYGTQPERLGYIHFGADRLALRLDIQLNTRLGSLTFDKSDNTWAVRCEGGEGLFSRDRVMATACLSAPLKAEQQWVERVREVAQRTLLPTQATGYAGANVPGRAQVYLPYSGGVTQYLEHCRQMADNDD